ncbi:MAG: glycosyltransferase family 1 protein [Chloroflexi bacterium]|nr:MAG: glycosyltransferase family 1 protein [Chloroflexota bacterium]
MAGRKRVGIDVTAALTQGGGIGRYTRELVRAVTAVDQTHEYHFFSARPPATLPVSDPLPSGEHVHHHPAPLDEHWLYRLWYRLRLPIPVQWFTGSLDLFHSPDFVLPPVAGHIPTLLTVHDLSFVHYPDTFPENLVAYLNRVVPWSVRRATHVLADSQATKTDLETIWGVPAEKITVLYCGVNEHFRPVTDGKRITAVLRKYQLDNIPYILTVGTVQPRKNYQMLIRAFAPIATQFPHHLVIAGGRGWLYDDMLAEVQRLNLTDRVHFIGFVDDDDLPALYSAATLFVFPSLYEGFGLPLLEAMACGTPVVTSNASSLPEVVGETAVLLPPHTPEPWTNTLHQLLTDSNARSHLQAQGFQQVQKFSWETAAHQLIQIYKHLLKK